MRLTLADVKPSISRLLSMSASDPRVVGYINDAQERLFHRGKWQTTYGRYAVTTADGLLTWPRQLETIEAVAICSTPGVVRNGWFEFLENGPGVQSKDGHDALTLYDRGESCSRIDVAGTNNKLRAYSTVSADIGKKVLLQGFDQNKAWIRTQDGSTWIDGEYVTLTATYADTVNMFSKLCAVQKPITSGPVKLYEFSPATSVQRIISQYEVDETRPVYRRSLIPGIGGGDCPEVVTVMGRLRFRPALVDLDWLMIDSEPALKEMVMAVRKAENNLPAEAQHYEQRAERIMQERLMHHLGDGTVSVPRFESATTFGGGGVPNLV